MKYQLVNQNEENAMRLQEIGVVKGTPASEIKKGSFLMWNFGSKSEVIDIIKETKSTIVVKEKSCDSNYVGNRKMFKKRLVCLLEN